MSTSMSTVSRDSYILSGSHSWLAETKALREAIGKAKETQTRQTVASEAFELCGNRWQMAIDCINDRIMSFVKCLDPDPSAENRKTIVMDIVMVNINAAMLFKKTQDENWTSPWSTTTTDVLKILDLELNKVSFEVSLRLYKPRPFDRNNMWNQLRVQNKFTDVILQPSSGDPLPAHKAVLAASSPVMNTMLNSSFSEGKSGTIQLPFPHAVVESALEYMYSGEYNLAHTMQMESIADLIQLSIMYELPELFDTSLTRLNDLLTINVIVEATQVYNLLKQQFCDDGKTDKKDQPDPHKPFYTSVMRFSKEMDGFVQNNVLALAKKYISSIPPPKLKTGGTGGGLQPLEIPGPKVSLPQVPLPEKEKETIPETKSDKAAQKREREEEETTCVSASKRAKVTAETPSLL